MYTLNLVIVQRPVNILLSYLQASLEVRQAGRRTLSQLSNTMGVPNQALTLLHFNDVYNVESRQQEPVGGAARFCTAIKSFSHLQPLVLFSGDCFSPSMCKYLRQLFLFHLTKLHY